MSDYRKIEDGTPPDGCRWCEIEARTHFQRWRSSVGWHTWEPPTTEQRKARMLARRTSRKRSVPGAGLIALMDGTDA